MVAKIKQKIGFFDILRMIVDYLALIVIIR